MSGWDKAPEYGGPPATGWTVAIFIAVVLIGATAAIWLLV